MKNIIYNTVISVFIVLEILLISCQEQEIKKLQAQLISYKSNSYIRSQEKEKDLRIMKQDIEKLQQIILMGEY